MAAPTDYLSLADHTSLRILDGGRYLHDRRHDELYELGDRGYAALARLGGEITVAEANLSPDFLATCLEEGLALASPSPARRPLRRYETSLPVSLRYLEVQITRRCNLGCRHCYLGDARPEDMGEETFGRIIRELPALGGLRLMVSGGEPLAHPRWEAMRERLADFPGRRVLLTNGVLLTEEKLWRLPVDEVQISLDGMEPGHETLRGPGTFPAAVAAARRVRERGLDLAIGTMAHRGNLGELDQMAALVGELDAGRWDIDAPCIVGRLADHPELALTPEEAARAMAHGFGGAYHGGNGAMTCGLHLATVGADGAVAPCGFYFDKPLGRVEEGLEAVWARRTPQPVETIPACRACPAVEECGGGCRYRAPSRNHPDPVMCALHGVPCR